MALPLTDKEVQVLAAGDDALAGCPCEVCPQIAARAVQLADFMRKAMPDSADADLARSLLAILDFAEGRIGAAALGLFTWAACELTRVERGAGIPPA